LHFLELLLCNILLFFSLNSISGSHDFLLFWKINLNHLIVFNSIICLSRRTFLELLLKGLSLLAIHKEFLFHDIVILCLHLLFLFLNLLSRTYLIGDLFLKAVVCFHQSFNLIVKFYLLGILFILWFFDLFLELALECIFFFEKFGYFFLQSFPSFLQTLPLCYQWIIHILKFCEFPMLLLIEFHLISVFLLLRFLFLKHVLICNLNCCELFVLLF